MEQAIAAETSCLSGIRKEHGQQTARALMVKVVVDVTDFFNVSTPMTDNQIAQTVDLILEDFWMLKLEDIKVCFNNAKKGKYGQLYNRLDGMVILEWLQRYTDERIGFSDEQSYNEHLSTSKVDIYSRDRGEHDKEFNAVRADHIIQQSKQQKDENKISPDR